MPRSVKRKASRKRNPKYNTKKSKLTKKIGSQKGGAIKGTKSFKKKKINYGISVRRFHAIGAVDRRCFVYCRLHVVVCAQRK